MRNRIISYKTYLKKYARKLRKESQISERILWSKIRRRALGVQFHRQLSIDNYIVDFYCHELKLIVEIDGDIHISQKEYDKERETILIEMGYKIYRIKNKEVNSESRLEHFINFCKLLKQKPIIQ